MPVRFEYPELVRELRDLQRLAGSRFLANEHVLDQYTSDLERLQYQQHQVTWEIPVDRPLRTTRTRAYEVDGNGFEVYGEVSGLWTIRRLTQRRFEVVGQASFVARIIDGEGGRVLAEWHFDMALPNAPGTWLHSQMSWHGTTLPVPRFPSLVVTLVDVVDFLLGELYQRDWPVIVQRRENGAQNFRLVRLLEAMLVSIRGKGPIHGLMSLKHARPDSELFI
jgi:hypothetical protein